MIEIYFLACLCVIFPLLTIFTKLHDGAVNVGDIFFCIICSMIPVVNVIALVYIMCQTAGRREWFDKVLF